MLLILGFDSVGRRRRMYSRLTRVDSSLVILCSVYERHVVLLQIEGLVEVGTFRPLARSARGGIRAELIFGIVAACEGRCHRQQARKIWWVESGKCPRGWVHELLLS